MVTIWHNLLKNPNESPLWRIQLKDLAKPLETFYQTCGIQAILSCSS